MRRTDPLRELMLVVETDEEIGTPVHAAAVLSVLCAGTAFTPDRYGTTEPLRAKFDCSSLQLPIDLWQGRDVRPGLRSGGILLRRLREPASFGSVRWVEGQRTLNTMQWQFSRESEERLRAAEVLDLCQRLFAAASGQFGFVCEREEYLAKSVEGWWRDARTGRGQGGSSIGHDRTKHLPGIYWATFFGPAYVRFFGASVLEGCPAERSESATSGGWLLVRDHSPDDWNTSDARGKDSVMRRHLGEDAFFDRAAPNRPTRAPAFRLAATDSGQPKIGTGAPIASEYLRTESEIRSYLSGVAELAEAFARRIGRAIPVSAAELGVVDGWLRERSAESQSVPERQLVLEVSAYFGEVLSKELDGRWVRTGSGPCLPQLQLPRTGSFEDPIVRAVKAIRGDSSLAEWYDLLRRGIDLKIVSSS